jgi:hypothetical protein
MKEGKEERRQEKEGAPLCKGSGKEAFPFTSF